MQSGPHEAAPAPSPSPSRFTIPDDVVAEVLDGEAVLLNLTSGVYFGLNETGTRVWQLIQTYGDLPTVVRCMADEFAIDAAKVDRDVMQLVQDLLEKRLLVADVVP